MKPRANIYVMVHIFAPYTTNTIVVEAGNCNYCQSISPISIHNWRSSALRVRPKDSLDMVTILPKWRQDNIYIDVTFTLSFRDRPSMNFSNFEKTAKHPTGLVWYTANKNK